LEERLEDASTFLIIFTKVKQEYQEEEEVYWKTEVEQECKKKSAAKCEKGRLRTRGSRFGGSSMPDMDKYHFALFDLVSKQGSSEQCFRYPEFEERDWECVMHRAQDRIAPQATGMHSDY
jgi:hypothetical protein